MSDSFLKNITQSNYKFEHQILMLRGWNLPQQNSNSNNVIKAIKVLIKDSENGIGTTSDSSCF